MQTRDKRNRYQLIRDLFSITQQEDRGRWPWVLGGRQFCFCLKATNGDRQADKDRYDPRLSKVCTTNLYRDRRLQEEEARPIPPRLPRVQGMPPQ